MNSLFDPLIEIIGGGRAAFDCEVSVAQRYPLGSLLIGTTLSFVVRNFVDMIYQNQIRIV